MNTGLLDSPPRPKDYVGGAVSGVPEDVELVGGDHRPFIAQPHEMQLMFGKDFSTCTNYAATDTVENYLFRKFGIRVNYEERALAIMAGQGPNGNSLWNVAEAIRTKGLVPAGTLPWTSEQDTFAKYISWTPAEQAACEAAGKKWLEEYDFQWEWIYDDYGRGMRWALERSPLFAASMYASEAGKDPVTGIYHTDLPNSPQTTHAIVLLNQTPEAFKDIDDSYATQLKRLNTDFRVPIGMRFYIAKKQPQPPMIYPPKNSLVVVVDTGERLMYVDGDKIYKDDAGKILLEVTARNADPATHLSRPYPIVHVKAADIAHLKRVNLKGEPV